MCGISGFSLTDHDNARVNSNRLARELLLGIEHRGKDATGMAWRDARGDIKMHKLDVPASKYVTSFGMWKGAHSALLHTRAATQGSPTVMANNHPIRVGNIVGIHNGTVSNDFELFDTLGVQRIGKVDSEAIFAALAYGSAKDAEGKPLLPGCEHPFDALEYIEAGMAIGWMYDDNPDFIYLAKGDWSPLILAQTPAGSLLFASTAGALKNAAAAVGLDLSWWYEAKAGEIFVVKRGVIVQSTDFDVSDKVEKTGYVSWTNYRSGSTYALPKGGSTTTTKDTTNLPVGHPYSWKVDKTLLLPTRQFNGYSNAKDYEKRAKAVDDFFWTTVGYYADMPGDQQIAMAEEDTVALGGACKTGDWVTLTLGEVTCQGQVVIMPLTFPEGKYLIRAVIEREDGSKDIALVERTNDQLTFQADILDLDLNDMEVAFAD